MNRAAQQRTAIRRLTEALASPLPIGEVHQIVVEEARRLTDAASAALCLLVEGRDLLDFVAASGENARQIVGLRIHLRDSLSEHVVETGRPILIDTRPLTETGNLFAVDQKSHAPPLDTPLQKAELGSPDRSKEPLLYRNTGVHMPAGTRSAAVVPIYMNGRLIGTLSAQNKVSAKPISPLSTSPPGIADSPNTNSQNTNSQNTNSQNTNSQNIAFDTEDLDTLAMLAEYAALARNFERTGRLAREQSRELTVLYDAARTIAGSLNVQQVLDGVLSAICTHLEHFSAVLFLLNDERTHLFIGAERGLTEDEREIQLSVDHGAHSRVLHTGVPRLIANTEEEGDFEDLSERAQALSAMIAPIRSRDANHGIILVTSLQRHAYHTDDLKLLNAVGMQAGIAIENAWLYEDAQRQAEEATALYDLSQHINTTLNTDKVLAFVADSVMNLLKVDRFALYLHDKKSDRLIPRLLRDLPPRFEQLRPKVGEGIAGWVFEWQTPQAVSDVVADARNRSCPIDQQGIASTLCVPMQVGDEVVGVILAMSSKRRLFTVAEMELLYTIANQAAFAVSNSTLYQAARDKSHEMRRYFRRIARALGSAFEAQDLPQLMADLSIEIMRADRCALYRVTGNQLELIAHSRFRPTAIPDQRLPIGIGLAGWVAKRGQSLVIPCLDADLRAQIHTWINRDRLCSYLAIPIKSGRQTVGVIEIYTQEQRDFTPEEAQLLSAFARRARLSEKLPLPLATA